eukprot:scaffold1891_cov178-Amphora_coffeaeformis.AAC.8
MSDIPASQKVDPIGMIRKQKTHISTATIQLRVSQREPLQYELGASSVFGIFSNLKPSVDGRKVVWTK